MIKSLFLSLSALCLALLASCSSQSENGLKVAVSPVPHEQILKFIKSDLKAKGINLIIIVTDDYNMPNRALANKEIDANFFQHLPFLEEQIKQFNYPIKSIASIEIEPMGFYSKKIKSLDQLKNGATIAIPNDPTNESRALKLLQEHGFIELDTKKNLHATILDIWENPKNLKFIEADAAMLPRTLDDVDLAAINTNYALQAALSPKNALLLEGQNSPYANVVVIREGDENRPEIIALKEALTSDKMKEFLLKEYNGAVIPAF